MPGTLSAAVCSTFSVASAINTLSTRGDSHEQRSGAKPFRVALLLPRKVASALTKFTKASETNKTLTILLRFNEAIIVFDTTGYRLTLTERNELELTIHNSWSMLVVRKMQHHGEHGQHLRREKQNK